MKSISITKLELIFLGALIVIGSFLRLYNIEGTATFLGDQGRDAIIAKNILKNGDIALIGPVTSVGNMYLGPFYYYFMVPWLALSYPNPVGPAVGVAIVSIITIPIIYFISKEMFSKRAALFSTALFTTSSVIVDHARFSWNPNLAPTVGLLLFYFLYKTIKEKKYTNIIWATICFSIITQLHYMAISTGAIILFIVIAQLIKDKKNRSEIIKNSIYSLLIFLVSLVPLVIFDIRHDHLILNGFNRFITSPEQHIRPMGKLLRILSDMNGNAHKLTTQLFGIKTYLLDQVGLLIILITSIFIIKSKKKKIAYSTLFLWTILTIAIISLYSSSIFTHYISFTFAISAILIGVVFSYLYNHKNKIINIFSILIFLFLIVINTRDNQAFLKGSNHISKSNIVSKSIQERVVEGEKYNVVLISGTGDIDAQNYRYFLETTDKPPVLKENRGEVESLFIIQEDYFDTNPVDSPIYEIVVFPDKNPKEVYTIDNGPTVTVLRKSDEQ